MSKRTDRAAIAKLEALYAQVPAVACAGRCAEACGPVPMTPLEADRLRRTAHQAPALTAAGACVYLTPADRCRVYAVRPLICRVWGALKRLSCPHGCEPARWLTDHEFLTIAQAVERLGGGALVRTAATGLEPMTDSFASIQIGAVSPAEAEALAERTRGLRALHGGRIFGVRPGDGRWISLDDDEPSRDR